MAKYTTTVSGNTATQVGLVIRPRYADAFYGQLSIFGNFDSGSVAVQYSPDGGTTKISLVDPSTGTAYAPTANAVIALNPLGATADNSNPSILYVTPSSAGAALTAILEDNR